MRTKLLLSVLATTGLILGGCGSKSEGDGDGANTMNQGDSGDEGDESATSGIVTGGQDEDTSAGEVDTGTAGESGAADESGGFGFINEQDGGGVSIECSVWDQDCPDGQKCMPWANDGGSSWNATKCTPRDPNPAQPGDACTVEGSGISGIDNCDVASMCWDVDGETNTGICVAFCTGAEANPVCDDPQTSCSIANEGVLILCLPTCDPLAQDCQDGQACYGIDDAYVCAPDASGEMGAYGDPCEFLNACDPGLECLNADGVPGCQGALGCCSPFCDLDDPEAGANCPGADGGQECTPAFEEGQAPPGYEAVGYCFIPA